MRSTKSHEANTRRTPWFRSLRVISWIAFLLLFLVCSCAKLPRRPVSAENQQPVTIATKERTDVARVNINTASTDELEKLPGIGNVLATRIVAHREKYGPFRRAEHLMMVQGISDQKFRAIRDLVTVE